MTRMQFIQQAHELWNISIHHNSQMSKFLLKTVKHYNKDDKKEDKPHPCRLGPFPSATGDREVQNHAGHKLRQLPEWDAVTQK